MKMLHNIAAICIILFVVDHFAREIYIGYKTKMLEQEIQSQEFRDELRGMGLYR